MKSSTNKKQTKTRAGAKRFYQLRNGIKVHVPYIQDGGRCYIAKDYAMSDKIDAPWKKDEEIYLLTLNDTNPLHWIGGAFGPEYNVVRKTTAPKRK